MDTRIEKLLKRVQKIREDKKLVTTALLGAVVLAFGLGLYAFRGALFVGDQTFEEVVEDIVEEISPRHPLTGLPVEEKLDELPQVYAVMLDHHVNARPQAGLDDAFLVIEAPVEGGITRLEAFYLEGQNVEKLGPVRSARPYFVDWADELDAMYVHVGGSPQSLDLIATRGTFDLNQFFNGPHFWRDSRRFAPHNVYTSIELLDDAFAEAVEEDRHPNLVYGLWEFKDDAKDLPEEPVSPELAFGERYHDFFVRWEYESEVNSYLRLQPTSRVSIDSYLTEEGDEVYARNVVVMETDIEVIDSVGRRDLRTKGEGKAWIFQDGTVIEGTWKKPSVTKRLRFYDENDEEIAFNAGTTWIEVIDSEDRLEY